MQVLIYNVFPIYDFSIINLYICIIVQLYHYLYFFHRTGRETEAQQNPRYLEGLPSEFTLLVTQADGRVWSDIPSSRRGVQHCAMSTSREGPRGKLSFYTQHRSGITFSTLFPTHTVFTINISQVLVSKAILYAFYLLRILYQNMHVKWRLS